MAELRTVPKTKKITKKRSEQIVRYLKLVAPKQA